MIGQYLVLMVVLLLIYVGVVIRRFGSSTFIFSYFVNFSRLQKCLDEQFHGRDYVNHILSFMFSSSCFGSIYIVLCLMSVISMFIFLLTKIPVIIL